MAVAEITHHTARVNGVRLHVALAGKGQPLYLLHGYPQSWFMWRKLVPLLAGDYQLVMPDLRGYGDSDKPAGGYDKRTMALDILELSKHLGHSHFALVGHDRGARVAHRFALDHPDSLAALSLLDIVPTKTVFDNTERTIARGSWHWFFFQVPDLPEALIAANPEALLRHFFRNWSHNPTAIEEAAVQEYLRAFKLEGTIRATLEDYRAGATEDLDLDGLDAHKRISKPTQVLWGDAGRLETTFHVLDCWQERAEQVEGHAIADCGHFLAEEQPQATAKALKAFLAKHYGKGKGKKK